MSEFELKKLACSFGGRFHGPNIEHLSIPETSFYKLAKHLMEKQSMQGEALQLPEGDREAIEAFMLANFSDKTFRHYIRKTLAGDFAYQLANALRKLYTHAPDSAAVIAELQAQVEELREDAGFPRLTVRLCSFPESNGKRNWTAQLVRVGGFDGLIGTAGGITVAHGELWNRVAYEAERTRYLLGERDTEPHILDYGDDIKTPEEWKGETRLRHLNAIDSAIKGR